MQTIHVKLFLSILIVALLIGCKVKSPCFEIENAEYLHLGRPIQFVNCTEKADDYLWNFGDDSTSTEENPVHSYANPGDYEVSLTAISGDVQKTVSKTIDVQYAKFSKVTITRLSPSKPNGLPWDPDGSEPDIYLVAKDCNMPPGLTYWGLPIQENVTIPYEYTFTSGPGIGFCELLITLYDVNLPYPTDRDTVGTVLLTPEMAAQNKVVNLTHSLFDIRIEFIVK